MTVTIVSRFTFLRHHQHDHLEFRMAPFACCRIYHHGELERSHFALLLSPSPPGHGPPHTYFLLYHNAPQSPLPRLQNIDFCVHFERLASRVLADNSQLTVVLKIYYTRLGINYSKPR